MAATPRHLIRRAWLRRAARLAAQASKNLADVLAEINDALLSGTMDNGQVLISTSEAGGSVSFTLPPGHTPLELAALNEEAFTMAISLGLVPPDAISAPRLGQRLRVSFAKATI